MKKLHLITLLVLGNLSFLFAQNKNSEIDFTSTLKELIASKTKDYVLIKNNFRPYSRDTIKVKEFIKASKNSQYLEGESYALNLLGEFYRNRSMYDRAIAIHEQAKKLADSCDNIDLKISSLNMLGVVYRRTDKLRSALDYHSEAYKIASSIEEPSKNINAQIAISQNSMGNVYLTLEQEDLAIKHFERSMKIEEKLNNILGLAINNQNIGYAKEQKGFLDSALDYYQKSLQYNLQLQSKVGEVICFNSIAKVYIKQKKLDIANTMLTKALKIGLDLEDQYYISQTYINIGWLNYHFNKLNEAKLNLEKGLEISKKYNFTSYEIEAHKYLSLLKEKQGDFKQAMFHHKTYTNLEESINNARNLHYVSDLIIKYENEDKVQKIKNLSNANQLMNVQLQQNNRLIYSGIIGLILLSIILFFVFRNHRVKEEKKIIMLEQDMLRSQMNPHFIFNSLNSIKLYIINNEKENAVYYLNKFSKLIRKILIASTEKEMSLKEELETMDLYMNIENIRFSNEIIYTTEIAKNVDLENIMVPSLILQPFLENSLWHGLSSKKNDKKIVLKVDRKSSDFISVTITDNGIGREASGRIKDQKTLKRKSVGISLTKERLENFSKRFSNTYNIEIKDLYDANNNPSGTQVIIDIPTNEVKLRTA